MNYDEIRVGHGYDVHPYGSAPEKSLVLAGVEFDLPGLVGHSDGDVVVHAVIDSLLSPIGLGDIGLLFSDSDPDTKGSNSMDYLAEVMSKVETQEWTVINIDITAIADGPKIAPHREMMASNIAGVTGGSVTVKGKRTEGVAHNIAAVSCHVVALLGRKI